MTTVKATIKDRRLELDVPEDWPDGIEVEIHPLSEGSNSDPDILSPEEIARTLAAMDRIEPFDLTDAELVAMECERQAAKARDKAEFAERGERLRGQWE
jgi:hypothetical protein